METYPKLLAIGIMLPIVRGGIMEYPPRRIYLIEDENCYIGYARGKPEDEDEGYPPVLKISIGSIGALRWCRVAFPPKGDENVEELYREIYHIIQDDRKMDYTGEYNCIVRTRHFSPKKNFDINISNPKRLKTKEEKEAFQYY